jgi:hypothetical protein
MAQIDLKTLPNANRQPQNVNHFMATDFEGVDTNADVVHHIVYRT